MKYFKENKYNAIATTIDGIRFSSMAEAELYQLLKADEKTLHIDAHVPITLPGGLRFNIDFILWKKIDKSESSDVVSGVVEAIECKGFETEVFKKLRRLFDSTHPLSPLIVFRKEGNKWVNL